MASAAAPGGGRRMLIPKGQITIAQLNAMQSSGAINASQLQSIAQGKTVLKTAAVVKSAQAADQQKQQQTSASGGMLASKFAPAAAKPANFSGPKIVTVHGSASAAAVKRVSAAAAADPPSGNVGNGGSAAAKPSTGQIRDSSRTSSSQQGEITKPVPLCGTCRSTKAKFACSYCTKKWYCSRQCQLADWDAHEDECMADGE